MKNKVKYYIFFPYLKISKKLEFCGVNFYPSNKLDYFDDEDRKNISLLSDKFYISNNYKIKNMAVTIIKEKSDLGIYGYDSDIHTSYENILKIRELLGFLYSIIQKGELNYKFNFDLCSVFALRYKKRVGDHYYDNKNVEFQGSVQDKNADKLSDGYIGVLNAESAVYNQKKTNIFPPYPNIRLLRGQDLYSDLQSIDKSSIWGFLKNLEKTKIIKENERLIRSLQWYNSANRSTLSKDDELINLCIAFESLLDLEKDKSITKRFKSSIEVIIGKNDKFDSWIDQFYDARSNIVHGEDTENLFYNNDKASDYGKLVAFGRKIFRILFMAILHSEYIKTETDLNKLFKSNQERIKNIFKKMNNSNDIRYTLESNLDKLKNMKKYKFILQDHIDHKDIIHLLEEVLDEYSDKFDPSGRSLIEKFLKRDKTSSKLLVYEKINKIINDKIDDKILKIVNNICIHYTHTRIIDLKNRTENT